MSKDFSLSIVSGGQFANNEDRRRAKDAAAAVFASANALPLEAGAEYLQQLDADIARDDMTGLARVWLDAEQAADLALTEGWADPDGASCVLDCPQ